MYTISIILSFLFFLCAIVGFFKYIAAKIGKNPEKATENKNAVIGSIILFILFCVIGGLISDKSDKSSHSTQVSQSIETTTEAKDVIRETETKAETVKETEKIKETEEEKIDYNYYEFSDLKDDLDRNAMNAQRNHVGEYVCVFGKLSSMDASGGYISISDPYDEWSFGGILCHINSNTVLEKIYNLETDELVLAYGKIENVGEIIGYTMDLYDISSQ